MTQESPKKPIIDARPVLDRLAQLHPRLFGARFLPLKLGIFHDLMAAHPDAFTKEELKAALGVHARSTRYLEAVASGTQRHDLGGEPVEAIAPEHVHHAIVEVFKRRRQRAKGDLKPWVVERLVRAIDASKLARADYVERVGAKDDESLALLDEAFDAIAARDAKREAVRRAYQASGKSAEEFAEMYGMALGDVRQAVGQP